MLPQDEDYQVLGKALMVTFAMDVTVLGDEEGIPARSDTILKAWLVAKKNAKGFYLNNSTF